MRVVSTGNGKSRTVAQVGGERLAALNSGTLEAANLSECLAVDFAVLMAEALPDVDAEAVALLRQAGKTGILKRMGLAGRLLLDRMGAAGIARLASHPSDTVRGWACFMIGATEGPTIVDRLETIRPLADDHHFGVREWAWMAVRSHMAADLETSIRHLCGWAADPSERIRRFCSESIRPRGVWSSHIVALKQEPALALPVLELLKADASAYVQDSVGNWLNDAAKDQPDWVRAVCRRWQAEMPDDPHVKRIIKRALRSLK